MADRYGLLSHPSHNGIKLAKFTLLTLYHSGGVRGGAGDAMING
jgi:hypothetical protein